MAYFLGLDVSTTSSKALLIDHNGTVLGTASSPHTLSSPKPLWSEQDPAQWWQAVVQSIRAVISQTGILPSEIEAVGLTGQMHGLVLLDEHGEALRQRFVERPTLPGAVRRIHQGWEGTVHQISRI